VLRLKIECRGAFVKRSKEQSRGKDAKGMISAEQGNGDADESVFRRKPNFEPACITKNFGHTNEPGQCAGK
jgi:hypothetical protein